MCMNSQIQEPQIEAHLKWLENKYNSYVILGILRYLQISIKRLVVLRYQSVLVNELCFNGSFLGKFEF